MRFAIFGDIHANLEALQAVLKDAEAHNACFRPKPFSHAISGGGGVAALSVS